MSEGYKPDRNWGCLLAYLIALPLLTVIMLGAVMAGGGCEGRHPPCQGDYSGMWIGFAIVLVLSGAAGWALNKIIAWRRSRSG